MPWVRFSPRTCRHDHLIPPFLVQAEILAGIRALAHHDLDSSIHQVSAADRAAIAATWLDYFNR